MECVDAARVLNGSSNKTNKNQKYGFRRCRCVDVVTYSMAHRETLLTIRARCVAACKPCARSSFFRLSVCSPYEPKPIGVCVCVEYGNIFHSSWAACDTLAVHGRLERKKHVRHGKDREKNVQINKKPNLIHV